MNIYKISILAFMCCLYSCKQKNEAKATGIVKDSIVATSQEQKFEFKPVTIDSTQFPKEIKFKGNAKEAIQWTDKLGDHIVITTETGVKSEYNQESNMDCNAGRLFAFHYIKRDGLYVPTWKVNDGASGPGNVKVSFIDKTFQVTDLNNDSIAEVWMMYIVTGKVDANPVPVKVIMYNGDQKYTIKGVSKSNGMKNGGEHEFDKLFDEGPKVFKDFAEKLWNENVVDKH